LTVQSSLKLAIDGHPPAVDALIARLRPRIERMSAYYARCCGLDSDDLRQEAWIGLLEALPGLDLSIGQPEQYLICCARWRMLDAARRAQLRRCERLEPEHQEAVSPGASGYRVSMPRSGTHDDAVSSVSLGQFVGQLDSVQRRVVHCLMDGMTWRETAHELGCTSPNIAYHVRRLRKRYLDWSEAS